MRLGTHGKCSINWHGHEEEELLLVPRQSCKGAGGKNGANGVPQKDCGQLLRGQPSCSQRSPSRIAKYEVVHKSTAFALSKSTTRTSGNVVRMCTLVEIDLKNVLLLF